LRVPAGQAATEGGLSSLIAEVVEAGLDGRGITIANQITFRPG